MSLRDELHTALRAQGVQYENLKVDKNDNYKGRECTTVHLIINGLGGPVFYDTSITDDLKLPDDAQATLIAKNAKAAYASHIYELAKEDLV